AVIMILAGGIIANQVQKNFGQVKVTDVRFQGKDGATLSALLYVPQNATPQTPAPAIQAIHGYINSRETQSGFAIEFARRGWVVLALDQMGHGYSTPPVGANGYGAIDGLAYLRTLDFVDKNRIGLEGHSMGGWASVIAAASRPNDYAAMVLEGSSTATKFSQQYVPIPGSPVFPKNLAVVFSTCDEFSMLMWEVPVAKDVINSEPLKKVFGTTAAIEPGKIYGSIKDGNARVLYQPKTTHPGDHISVSAIGYAIEWFQKTLGEVTPLPASNQIWYWKEIATLISLIGCLLFIFAFGGLLLRTRFFSALAGAPQNPKPAAGVGWWIGALLMIIIPAITYFPLNGIGNLAFKASWLFPQQVTNTLLFWLIVNMVITLILFLVWHMFNRRKGANAVSYGIASAGGATWKKIGLSAILAVLVIGVAYLSVVLTAALFTVDYRFWIMQLKPMSGLQFAIALRYVIPFLLFYLVFAIALHGQLRSTAGTFASRMIKSVVVTSLGYLVLLLLLYVPLFTGGPLGVPDARLILYAIVAIQVLPLFIIVTFIS
ncbi:MAG TPA: alpha/beta fold hydrolase, partial [Smithellaceae bacterium]|nr:alpha/beta fold hydrolase [Smithellaceae bacterium]